MLLFRAGNPQPKITLSSGSTLTMDVDGDTGDESQILGEGGAKSVDIRIQSEELWIFKLVKYKTFTEHSPRMVF